MIKRILPLNSTNLLWSVLPFIALVLSLSILLVQNYQQLSRDQEATQQLIMFQNLTDLIYELSAEKSYAVSYYHMNGADYEADYARQMKRTDRVLKAYHEWLVDYYGSLRYPAAFSNLETFTLDLRNLRNGVQERSYANYQFIYSQGIIEAEKLFSSRLAKLNLAEDETAFVLRASLNLANAMAHERARVESLFQAEAINYRLLLGIQSAITIQEASIEKLKELENAAVDTTLAMLKDPEHFSTFYNLREAVISKLGRVDELNHLLTTIGYGSFIHDFKNYVIRGEQRYFKKVQQDYFKGVEVLNQYRNLKGLSKAEFKALNTINETIEQYYVGLLKARAMLAEGKTVKQIDAVVKVDDTPALNAIEVLKNNLGEMETRQWRTLSTERIDLIKKLQDEQIGALQRQLEAQLLNEKLLFWFLVVLAILSALSMSVLFRHLKPIDGPKKVNKITRISSDHD